MRYKDFATKLFEDNSRPARQGYGTFTAIEPKTLDMVRNVQQWDRDKSASKAAIAKAKAKENPRPYDPQIQLGGAIIPVRYINAWMENHNEQQAFENFSKLKTLKLPKHVIEELKADQQWQASILKVLELCEVIMDERKLPPPNQSYGNVGSSQLERMGYDPHAGYEAVADWKAAIQKVLDKHNIDRHGRRLPPR